MQIGQDNPQILFRALAEQLKLPLVQIAHGAEMAGQIQINNNARNGLQLLENFILSLDNRNQIELNLEPVAVGAVINDTLHKLSSRASDYRVEIDYRPQHRQPPVMASYRHFCAGMEILIGNFIENCQLTNPKNSSKIIINSATRRQKIQIGIYGIEPKIISAYRSYLKNRYTNHLQPAIIKSLSSLYLADNLLQMMSSTILPTHKLSLSGLNFQLNKAKQLKMMLSS